MSDNESRLVTVEQVHAILKDHFPEYLSGFCLCGQPIGTYIAWIDHIDVLLDSSESQDDQSESNL